ncbi:MAG TPA: cytochrome P450 [Mycobacteriales bacterium]|nr:cytochrome P450 [Mycobacteriales bacterium]
MHLETTPHRETAPRLETAPHLETTPHRETTPHLETAAPLPLVRSSPLDPPAEYARLRAEDPVSRLRMPNGQTGWLLTRYSDVRAVLADPRFSSRNGFVFNPVRPLTPEAEVLLRQTPGQFIGMDPPEHTRFRRMLTGQFTVRRMRELEPRIAEIVSSRLDALAGPPVDLVAAFTLPVPSLVICELLGVPYADRADFQRRSRTLLSVTADLAVVLEARQEIRDYITGLVRSKRQHPADDLLSGLARDDTLTDEELTSVGALLLVAGHETTANMLALGTLTLLRRPDRLAQLAADPALLDRAVEELLRYLTIIQFGLVRLALADVPVGGVLVRAGEPVVASLAAANRDPAHFADPETLDLAREYAPHLAFGHGVHQCLGQQLARTEMRLGFGQLLARFPTLRLAVPPEDVPMREDTIVYGVGSLPVTW